VKAKVKKLLFTSSGAVYGPQPEGMSHIPETYNGAPNPMNPASAYGEGKRIGELLCSLAHADHGIETKIARCFAFVGPHLPLDAHFAIGNFINDVLHNRPIHIKGDGSTRRSYLYASDLAVWLWTILFLGAPSGVYNVGSQDSLTIAEVAEAVSKKCDQGVEVKILDNSIHRNRTVCYTPNCQHAEISLGVRQSVGLGDAIAKTLKWHN
jgi:dTDP-glucose 4,6-dehydratase